MSSFYINNTTLKLSSTTVELNAAGDAQVITVTSNTTWSVLSGNGVNVTIGDITFKSDNAWLFVDCFSDRRSIHISAKPNNDNQPRTTFFTVETTNKAISTKVRVTQSYDDRDHDADEDDPAYPIVDKIPLSLPEDNGDDTEYTIETVG